MVFNLYKNRGETPLECIERFRKDNPGYAHEKMTYAGRLDPLAEGVLLVLSGEDVFRKEEFTSLTKEYEAEVLLGVETDTYDMLGIVQSVSDKKIEIEEKHITQIEKKLVGPLTLPYPPYSSKTVQGVPLWKHSRDENDIESPEREMLIYDIYIQKFSHIYPWILIKEVQELTELVQGDFRQREINTSWQHALQEKEETFPVLHIFVRCGSGTYIRSLAHEIGKITEHGACLKSLRRIKVGEYIL